MEGLGDQVMRGAPPAPDGKKDKGKKIQTWGHKATTVMRE